MKITFEITAGEDFPNPESFEQAVKTKLLDIIDSQRFIWNSGNWHKKIKIKSKIEREEKESQYWILWLDSRNSVIRGWFNTLSEAIYYYDSLKQPIKNKVAVFDSDHKQVYPKE